MTKHNEIQAALSKQKQHLEEQGCTVAFIAIYGSQNYNQDIYTDTYKSDIDMKAIIVPTLDELVHNSKPISKTIDTEWGQCDVKDIRSYFQTLLKANPSYIETIFADYHIVDEKFKEEFDFIFKNREQFVYALRGQMIRAMYGMMKEKEKALCHPYPSIAHKIEKFGHDGKQLSHAYRLYFMMKDYFVYNKGYKESLVPESIHKDLLLNMKQNKGTSLDAAKLMMSDVIELAKELKETVLESIDEKRIDYSLKDVFLKYSQDIIKNKIISECGEKE